MIRILFFFPVFLSAMDLAPWYGYDLEFHPRASYRLENERQFFAAGLEGSYERIQADVQLDFRESRYDDFRMTGRYQWLSDIVAEPISLVTGLTLIRASRGSVNDKYTFHHGLNELELSLSIGREVTKEDYWTSRSWGVIVLGSSTEGSPWTRVNLIWEKSFCNRYFLAFHVNSLYGFGSKALHKDDFDGYGAIAHRSIDIGFACKLFVLRTSELTFGYSHRPYAENFREHVNTFALNFMYPLAIK